MPQEYNVGPTWLVNIRFLCDVTSIISSFVKNIDDVVNHFQDLSNFII